VVSSDTNQLNPVIKEQGAGDPETNKFAGKIYAVSYLKKLYSFQDTGCSYENRKYSKIAE
jgi:hypothetical protein